MVNSSIFDMAKEYAAESGRYRAELMTLIEWSKGAQSQSDAVAEVYRNLIATKLQELDNEFNAERV